LFVNIQMQVDSGAHSTPNLNSTAPSFTMGDFPALPGAETESIVSNASHSPIMTSTGSNFASAVRKVNRSELRHGRLENKNASEYGTSIGSSQLSQISPRQYNLSFKYALDNKHPGGGPAHAAPVWLETGEAVGNKP
jgi:hypothetical protein